ESPQLRGNYRAEETPHGSYAVCARLPSAPPFWICRSYFARRLRGSSGRSPRTLRYSGKSARIQPGDRRVVGSWSSVTVHVGASSPHAERVDAGLLATRRELLQVHKRTRRCRLPAFRPSLAPGYLWPYARRGVHWPPPQSLPGEDDHPGL